MGMTKKQIELRKENAQAAIIAKTCAGQSCLRCALDSPSGCTDGGGERDHTEALERWMNNHNPMRLDVSGDD